MIRQSSVEIEYFIILFSIFFVLCACSSNDDELKDSPSKVNQLVNLDAITKMSVKKGRMKDFVTTEDSESIKVVVSMLNDLVLEDEIQEQNKGWKYLIRLTAEDNTEVIILYNNSVITINGRQFNCSALNTSIFELLVKDFQE